MNRDQYHRIKELLESGRPVVPLLGAGISFASGIPTTPLIVNYLLKIDGYFDDDAFHPTWDSKLGAVRLTKEDHLDQFGYPDPYQLNAELWQAADLRPDELRIEITDRGRQYLTKLVKRKKQELMELGVEDDWRKVLEAVTSRDFRPRSRITSGRLIRILPGFIRNPLNQILRRPLAPREDNDRRDALFQVLVRGRMPGSSHRQLAFLTRRFGWRLMLTTNFDDLIERALISEGLDPKVFDVWREAELPASPLVRRGLSIVKLHGSAYGLRLGKALDDPLEEDEKKILCEYMGEKPILLIAGWSGQDKRIRDLVKAVVENDGEVIWAYFKPSDPPKIEEWRRVQQIHLVPTYDAGAFLGELYARVASTHPVSKDGYEAHSQRPLGALDGEEEEFDLSKPIHLFTEHPESNVTGCAPIRMSAFASKSKQLNVARTIWVDVGTFQSVEELVVDIIRQCRKYDVQLPSVVLALNKEQSDLTQLLGTPESASGSNSGVRRTDRELDKAVGRVHEALRRGPYVLALDGIGSFGRPPTVHHGIPHAHAESRDVQMRISELHSFVMKLVERAEQCKDAYICLSIVPSCPRFGIGERGQRSPTPFQEGIQELINKLQRLDFVSHHASERGSSSTRVDLWSLTNRWDWEDLFALLCTFRRPRSIVALRKLASSYYRIEDDFLLDELDRLLGKLHDSHILLQTEGGYYWMSDACRDRNYDKNSDKATSKALFCTIGVQNPRVFHMFDHDPPNQEEKERHLTDEEKLLSLESLARLIVQHRDIADYYYTDLFLASKDPGPLFEHLYHQVAAIRYATILEAFFHKLSEEQSRQLCERVSGDQDAKNPVKIYLRRCQNEGPASFVRRERLNYLSGLGHTIRREEDFLLSHVPSDTLLSWVRWAREKDLPSLKLSFYEVNPDPDKEIEHRFKFFEALLVGEEAKILRERTDYKGCIQVRVNQIESIKSLYTDTSHAPAAEPDPTFSKQAMTLALQLLQKSQDKPAETILNALLDIAACYTRLGYSQEAEDIVNHIQAHCKDNPDIGKCVMRSYRVSAERKLVSHDGWNAKNDGPEANQKKRMHCQEAIEDCQLGVALVRESTKLPVDYFRGCCYFHTFNARANALLGSFDEAFQEFDRAVAGLGPEVGANRGALTVCALYLADALMLESDSLVLKACNETVNDRTAISMLSTAGKLFLSVIDDSDSDDILRRVTTPWIREDWALVSNIIPKTGALLTKLTGASWEHEEQQVSNFIQRARINISTINAETARAALKHSLAYWNMEKLNRSMEKLNRATDLIGSLLGKASQRLTRAEVALSDAERLLDRGRRNLYCWYLFNRLRAQFQFEWMLMSLTRSNNTTDTTDEEMSYAAFLEHAKTGLRAIRDAYDNIFEGSGVSSRFKMQLRILWFQLLIACGCKAALQSRRIRQQKLDCDQFWIRWIRLNRWTGLSLFVKDEGIEEITNNPYYEYFKAICQSIPDTLTYSLAVRAFIERHLKVFPNPFRKQAVRQRE